VCVPICPFTRPRSSNGGPRFAPEAPNTAANAAAAAFSKLRTGMTTPTEFFKWWIADERTGKRRLTTYAMAREEAAERFPDAEPNLSTREVRNLPEPGEARGNARPPS
jgi:hypothetical protein